MAQIKVYGLRQHLEPNRKALSDAIHACVVDALEYPPEKRFHRFIPLETENFIYPDDRSERYTIIEISIFEGRSAGAKKRLITLLFSHLNEALQLDPSDVEITIFETPRANWGIRGRPGDELHLNYNVDV